MRIDAKTQELIAVGASVTANCRPCLQFHVSKARENGSDEEEIAAAITVARAVREGASVKIDEFAARLSGEAPRAEHGSARGCGCGS